MRRIFFLVPPEVQLLDLTGPAHIFYEAKEYGAALEITYLGLSKEPLEASSAGVALGNLQDYSRFRLTPEDILFVPGLESHLFLSDQFPTKYKELLEWLQLQYQQGAKICSVCTGAYILGFADLFNGRRCTTHWKYFSDFILRFPKALLQKDRLLIKDGTIYSSAGVSAGIDLALFILEELYGAFFTSKIAKEVVIYFRRTESDPQLSAFLQHRNHVETRVHQVQDLIAQNLANKINIPELAEAVHMSPRNLTRLFKKTIGLTLGQYLETLRLELAQKMLKEGEKVSIVTKQCGLQSENQLRSLFKKNLQKLPSALKN